MKTIEELKTFIKEKHPGKPKARTSFTTGHIKIKKRFLFIFGNPVIGVEITNPNEVAEGARPLLNRYIPNEILQSLPFSQMLLLAIFYFPSSRFKKDIEDFIVSEWCGHKLEYSYEKPSIIEGIILPVITVAIFLPSMILFGFGVTMIITAGMILIIYLISLFSKK